MNLELYELNNHIGSQQTPVPVSGIAIEAAIDPSLGIIFYHDVNEIFWPQPIRSLKSGHVTGQGSMSPTWVGRVSDPGKKGFRKKCKNLDNIAVPLIGSLKSKWKNKQIKKYE